MPVASSKEVAVGDFLRTPLTQRKPQAQAIEESKSQFLERVTVRLREELVAECTRITTEKLAVFQQELEESKASAQATASTTLKTLEELSKTSRITNMQLQAELERMQVRSDSARQKSEELINEFAELRSFCLKRGLEGLNPEQQQAVPAFALEALRAELRQDHVKTKKCVSKLSGGIEAVAQTLAANDQLWNMRFDSLQKEMQKLREREIIPLMPSASGTCLSAAWPLTVVKEDDADVHDLEQPADQPANKQEFALEVVSMQTRLQKLKGVNDIANSTSQPDMLQAPCSQQAATAEDSFPNAAVTKLSGELTEAKAEVAEALELFHEAVRLGEVLKREIEGERKERRMDVRKLSGRLDSLDKLFGRPDSLDKVVELRAQLARDAPASRHKALGVTEVKPVLTKSIDQWRPDQCMRTFGLRKVDFDM